MTTTLQIKRTTFPDGQVKTYRKEVTLKRLHKIVAEGGTTYEEVSDNLITQVKQLHIKQA